MKILRRFSVTCKTFGRTVILETREWFVLPGCNVPQCRTFCACGKEHVGINLPVITH